jgi:hypothetical protein
MIRFIRRSAIPLALGLISAFAIAPTQAQAQSPGFDKYKALGPDAARVQEINANGFTMFVVRNAPGRPGLTWANGTSGTPNSYDSNNTDGILRRVASWGVQVIASNSGSTGNGQAVSQGVGVLMGAGLGVTNRFCASGHSQGGSGAVNASRLNANIICTIPVEPDNRFTAQSNGRDIKGPALILCGTADRLAPCGAANATSNGSGLFNQTPAGVPVVQVFVTGAPHTGANSPTGVGGLFSALVTAQTQAVLVGDPQAKAAMFGPNPLAGAAGLQQIRFKGTFPPK